MWLSVKGFLNKLDMFYKDVTGAQDHFPNVRAYLESIDNPDMINTTSAADFISGLIAEFNNRFKACRDISAIIELICAPSLNMSSTIWKEQLSALLPSINANAVELEMCDFVGDSANMCQLAQNGIAFWSSPLVIEKYALLSKIGNRLLVMFGSSYQCESLFSKLAFIKTKHRAMLTDDHTKHLLLLSAADKAPDFCKMITGKQFQCSH